jgi:hypothetical protein
MLTINRQGSEAMHDNPRPGQRQQYVDRSGEYRPAAASPADPRVILARGIVVLALLLVVVLIYFVWRGVYCWGDYYGTCAAIRGAEPVAFGALLCGLPAVAVVAFGAVWWQRQRNQRALERAEVARTALTLDRFGNPVSATALTALSPEQHLELYWRTLLIATELKRHTAPYEQLPAGLNSLNQAPALPPAVIAAEEPGEKPLAMSEWLPRLANAYHLMLAAETGGGKSTLAKTVLLERIKVGDRVVVIDPHGSEWFALKRYGAGRNYAQVRQALKAVYAEMDVRYQQRDQGRRDFPRLTVLIDEVPAIYENEVTRDTWKSFAKLLGSEARKVNISIILMTQSPLVQDIGINTSMRRNFSLVALDMPSIITLVRSLQQDRDTIELLRGQRYPAAAAFDGEVYVLDRSTVPIDPSDPGGDYEWPLVLSDDDEEAPAPTRRRYAMPPVAHTADSVPVLRASHNVMQSITHNTLNDAARDELVRILFRKGNTYREVREKLASKGLTIDQNRLTVLRDEALNIAS